MSLGSTIATARKSAGMSLDDLAERTSIRASLLREFENNHFERCGGETYTRGHVRNIAIALGADLATFLELFEAEQSTASRPLYDLLIENNVATPRSEKSRVSIKTLAIISASAVILVGGEQIIISNMNSTNSPTSSKSAPVTVASPSPTATPIVTSGSNVNLELKATRGSTWLLVSDLSGTVLYSGPLSQGESKVFLSSTLIKVRFGNAGAVDALLNGIAEPSLRVIGEVVDRSFGANSSN